MAKKRKDILIDYKLMDSDFMSFHKGKGLLDTELENIDQIIGLRPKKNARK